MTTFQWNETSRRVLGVNMKALYTQLRHLLVYVLIVRGNLYTVKTSTCIALGFNSLSKSCLN
jgi:hypothetical protein